MADKTETSLLSAVQSRKKTTREMNVTFAEEVSILNSTFE